jgi:hypothetical protein
MSIGSVGAEDAEHAISATKLMEMKMVLNPLQRRNSRDQQQSRVNCKKQLKGLVGQGRDRAGWGQGRVGEQSRLGRRGAGGLGYGWAGGWGAGEVVVVGGLEEN